MVYTILYSYYSRKKTIYRILDKCWRILRSKYVLEFSVGAYKRQVGGFIWSGHRTTHTTPNNTIVHFSKEIHSPRAKSQYSTLLFIHLNLTYVVSIELILCWKFGMHRWKLPLHIFDVYVRKYIFLSSMFLLYCTKTCFQWLFLIF